MKTQVKEEIERIIADIQSIKVQGATNVALSVLKGLEVYVRSQDSLSSEDEEEFRSIGKRLSNARENEPLARNGFRYVLREFRNTQKDIQEKVLAACADFANLVEETKKSMAQEGAKTLKLYDVILTHCHSSSATQTLITVDKNRKNSNEKALEVVSTETRPLYQGRKTAAELFDAGVHVTQIVDSACASFIIDNSYLPVSAIIVGCDELLISGHFINKVGTYMIALAAQKGKDPLYVVTTLLKLDPGKQAATNSVEQRAATEVWEDAPSGLQIINPAFEQVRPEYVTGYITEAGTITAQELESKAKELYPWMFSEVSRSDE